VAGRIAIFLGTALTAICCASPQVSNVTEVRLRGSDTMLNLNRRLAEGFMRTHPGSSIVVEGGGTGAGVTALVTGEVEIAAGSRPLAAEEVRALYDRFQTLGVRFLVAQDALSVYLNDANRVRSVTRAQLAGLFDGSIRSWSDVGGADLPVTVVVRPPSSGSHRFFRDHVLLGREYRPDHITAPTNLAVLQAVGGAPGAVGYGGLAFEADGVVRCAVDGVAPGPDDVRAGNYPLARYLAFYTVEPPLGLIKTFIDWCLAPAGQAIVADVGYLPLWPQGG
jgi:phosphate transport system substrate-binding protein